MSLTSRYLYGSNTHGFYEVSGNGRFWVVCHYIPQGLLEVKPAYRVPGVKCGPNMKLGELLDPKSSEYLHAIRACGA